MNAHTSNSTVERAFSAGRLCGLQKLSSTIECPFALTQPWERAAWLDGYATGQSKASGDSWKAKQSVVNLLSRYRDMKIGALLKALT